MSSIPILSKAALQRKKPLNIQDTVSKRRLLGSYALNPTFKIIALPIECSTTYLGSLKGISGLGTWFAEPSPFHLVCNVYPTLHSVLCLFTHNFCLKIDICEYFHRREELRF